jgi:ADP-heptose:LPS heptosyltransferase
MLKTIKVIWRFIRNTKKEIKFKLLSSFWDKKPNTKIAFKDIQSLCLLRWDNKLGDAVMCSALINSLEKYRPDIKLSIITGDISASWLSEVSDVNIIKCGKRGMKTAKSFAQYAGMFDVVVDISNGFSEKELLALHSIGASYYIGYEKEAYDIFNIDIERCHIDMFKRYHSVATLFIDKPDFEYVFPLPDYCESTKLLQPWFEEAKQKGKYRVAMNFFGSGKYRRFSLVQAITLVDRWTKENVDDCLLLIPVPNQNDFLAAVKKRCKNPDRVIYIDSACSIKNTLAILKFSDYCFTPDTSVVHMASAINTPVLAIYGGNQRNYQEWKPLANGSQVIFNPLQENRHVRIEVNNFDWNELSAARNKILSFFKV